MKDKAKKHRPFVERFPKLAAKAKAEKSKIKRVTSAGCRDCDWLAANTDQGPDFDYDRYHANARHGEVDKAKKPKGDPPKPGKPPAPTAGKDDDPMVGEPLPVRPDGGKRRIWCPAGKPPFGPDDAKWSTLRRWVDEVRDWYEKKHGQFLCANGVLHWLQETFPDRPDRRAKAHHRACRLMAEELAEGRLRHHSTMTGIPHLPKDPPAAAKPARPCSVLLDPKPKPAKGPITSFINDPPEKKPRREPAEARPAPVVGGKAVKGVTVSRNGGKYLLWGFKVPAVLLWMGNADWTEEQAARVLAAVGVPEPPYNTLHSRVRAGRDGKDYYGPVPKLKRSQADALTALLAETEPKSKKKGRAK